MQRGRFDQSSATRQRVRSDNKLDKISPADAVHRPWMRLQMLLSFFFKTNETNKQTKEETGKRTLGQITTRLGRMGGVTGGPVAPPCQRVDPPEPSGLKNVQRGFSVRRPCSRRSRLCL